jgi:hypothetical protein
MCVGRVLHFVPKRRILTGLPLLCVKSYPAAAISFISHVAGDFPRVADFFGKFEMVAPGGVPASQWNATEETGASKPGVAIYCGVARKT